MHTRASRVLHWLIPATGIGLMGLLFLQLGPATVLDLFRAIGASLGAIVLIFTLHESVRALALRRCLIDSPSPPFASLLWVRLMGEALRTATHTGPFLSEPARGWLLTRQGVTRAQAYGATTSELIANLFVSALVTIVVAAAALGAGRLNKELSILSSALILGSMTFLVTVAAIVFRRHPMAAPALRRLASWPVLGRWIPEDTSEVEIAERAMRQVWRGSPAQWLPILLLELLAQGVLIFEGYVALRAMGVPITFHQAALVEVLTKAANVIQFMGAAEGGYALVFAWLNVPAAAGFTLSLVKRVRSLVVATVGVGVLTRLTGGRRLGDVETDPDYS